MTRIIIIYFIVQCISVVMSGNALCSVSSHGQYSTQKEYHYHQYPLNVFYPNAYHEQNETCAEGQDEAKRTRYTCPITPVGCPLIEENFRDAVKMSREWPKATSLCSFKEALGNHSSTRLIVFGGSVTAGIDSGGCCDQWECYHSPNKRCAWSYQLQRWLSAHEAKISVHNMGKPGSSSVFTSEVVRSIMSQRGLGALSSKDLIFLDHSFNDVIYNVPVEIQKLEKGLERLIRTLLGMAVSMTDLPHIILFGADTRVWGEEENRYTTRYLRLAEHYGLRYYSFADALSSNASLTQQAVYHNYLTHKIRSNAHPPWYVHLAYADLISGLLRNEMKGCKHLGNSSASSGNSAPVAYVMPVPVSSVKDIGSCKENVRPFVYIDYNPTEGRVVPRIGTHKVLRPNSWMEKLDTKQRPGIMIEVSKGSTYSALHDAPLHYSLGINASYFRSISVLLQLTYLRSYTDAGQATLYLCGTHFKNLDALWEDYERQPYTLREALTESLNSDWCKHLRDEEDVVLTVSFNVTGPTTESMTKMAKPRGNQRFKIEFVSLCEFVKTKLW